MVSLFVHVDFGSGRQIPYSENNYDVLYYEKINSPFMVFNVYLDVLEKIVLNKCDKYLVPALLSNENSRECRWSTVCSHGTSLSMKKEVLGKKVCFLL